MTKVITQLQKNVFFYTESLKVWALVLVKNESCIYYMYICVWVHGESIDVDTDIF